MHSLGKKNCGFDILDICAKQLCAQKKLHFGVYMPFKIKWEFLKPFSMFWGIFVHAVMDKSAESGLKNIQEA